MSGTKELIEEVLDLTEATAKLGTGSRFKKVVKDIKKAAKHVGHKKIRDPKAVAAAIGRKKFGAKKMAKMAAAGRRKKA